MTACGDRGGYALEEETQRAAEREAGGTVFIVDDDAAVGTSLAWLVESVGLRAEVYANASDFLRVYHPDTPGCLVTDLRMPGMSGLDLQAALATRGDPLPVIVITAHPETKSAVAAMKGGALDFIEKPFSDHSLLESIQRAVALGRQRRAARARAAEIAQRLARLTRREREVLDGVVAGQSSREIAAALGMSPKTVEVHRSRIMHKLHAGSVAELVRLTMLAGAGSET